MLILHQIKLMTSNGFGILLILVERIKRDIEQTSEGLQQPLVGLKQQKNEQIENDGFKIFHS